jgi:hypothetical protein
MPRARKAWESLSPDYQRRLSRGGITKSSYQSGASLQKARGHAKTPEHGLRDAVRNPGKYRAYIAKRNAGPGQRETPEDMARRVNAMLDKAYANMKRQVGGYFKYNDKTVRANVYGGRTAESGEVRGMDYAEALWTSTADSEEIRANASEQYRANVWFYH